MSCIKCGWEIDESATRCPNCYKAVGKVEQPLEELAAVFGKERAEKMLAKAHAKAEEYKREPAPKSDEPALIINEPETSNKPDFSIEDHFDSQPTVNVRKMAYWFPVIDTEHRENISNHTYPDILSNYTIDEASEVVERKLNDILKVMISGKAIPELDLDAGWYSRLPDGDISQVCARATNHTSDESTNNDPSVKNKDVKQFETQPKAAVRKIVYWFTSIDRESIETILDHTHSCMSYHKICEAVEIVERKFEEILKIMITGKAILEFDLDNGWFSRLPDGDIAQVGDRTPNHTYDENANNDTPVANNDVEHEFVSSGLVICDDSGMTYTTQCGGYACQDRYVEGILTQTPLYNRDPYLNLPPEDELRTIYNLDDMEIKQFLDEKDESAQAFLCSEESLVRYFADYKHGSICCDGIDSADADFLDSLFNQRCPHIQVARDRLSQSAEAWLHILIDETKSSDRPTGIKGFGRRRGVLIWPNSD